MRTNYSMKNSITSMLNYFLSFLFLFITQTLFVKILGIEYAGLNGLFSNILTLLNLFELGLGSAITYNLYQYIAKEDQETIQAILQFYRKAYRIISLCIFLFGLLFIPFLKYIVKDVEVVNVTVIYILFLLNTVSTYFLAYKKSFLFACQKNYVIHLIHIGFEILLNVSQIIVILITKNYYLYLILKIICILLENTAISFKVDRDYPFVKEMPKKELDTKIKEDISSRVKALFVHKASLVVTNGTDNILISIFFGMKQLGLYTSYNYIISSVKTFFMNIVDASRASVGNLLVQKNYKKNYETFQKILFLNLWLAIFTSTCILLLMKPFIQIWLGKEYLLGQLILITLVINYFQTLMRSTFNIFKDSAGIWREDWYVPLIQLTLNLSFSFLFLSIFGMAGVFMGTIVSSLILWFYSYPKFVYKKLFLKDTSLYLRNLLKCFMIFVLVLSSSYYVSHLFSFSSIWLEFIWNVFLAIFLPNLILYFLFHKKEEFLYFKELLKNWKKVLQKQ